MNPARWFYTNCGVGKTVSVGHHRKEMILREIAIVSSNLWHQKENRGSAVPREGNSRA